MNKTRRILIASFAVCLLVNATAAQQQQTAASGIFLEIFCHRDASSDYLLVPGPNSKPEGGWFGAFGRIPSWQPPAGSLPVRAVNVLSRIEGDAVRINVSVFVGKKAMEKEEPVATYLVRENEKITVNELKQFGVVPFEITVVRVYPSSVATPPQVVNKTQSIEVLGFEPVESIPPTFTLVVRNLSTKPVSAVKINLLLNNRSELSSMPAGEEGKALIEPGGIYKTRDYGLFRIQHTPTGYIRTAPPNQTIVISTAVFEDGSYEGQPESAFAFRAYVAGRKKQLTRVIALFKSALQATDPDTATAVAKLKTQVSSLEIDAEIGEIQEVLKGGPLSGPKAEEEARTGLVAALSGIKRLVIKDIDLFEEAHRQPGGDTFQAWLSTTKERYEKWLFRLQSF